MPQPWQAKAMKVLDFGSACGDCESSAKPQVLSKAEISVGSIAPCRLIIFPGSNLASRLSSSFDQRSSRGPTTWSVFRIFFCAKIGKNS